MSGASGDNPFGAVDPTLGYLYQIRSALLWALQRLRRDQEFLVSIESLDDVTFETGGGEATDLFQTKHHLEAQADLSDASKNLWSTLRIWFEGDTSGTIPKTANLVLVTTGTASDGSAAAKVRATGRDEAGAKALLDATALSSTNKGNKQGYAAYLKAGDSARVSLLKRITVIDAAPTIANLDDELRREVFWAAGKSHLAAFLERLEGWWLRRILKQLENLGKGVEDRVGSVEVEARMSDLREEFKRDSLPIDDDLLEFTLDDATKAAHENSRFVWQLEVARAGKRRIANAIRDYCRAFEQRSRWLRDDLVVDMELDKYENRLVQEWEIIFDAMVDELGPEVTEEQKEQAARSVLSWAERTTIPIRPKVTEPFVTRGSLHMLSDEIRIGWHPEFCARLEELLTEKEGLDHAGFH